MPELTGAPRSTAAEILAIWPLATMVVDSNYGPPGLFVVLKEWESSLPNEPPAPAEDVVAEQFSEQEWYEYQYNERIPLHIATDEWMPTEIAERFGVRDDGWGVDYFPAEYLYPIEKQDEIEQALRDLGFIVIRDAVGSDGAFLDRWQP